MKKLIFILLIGACFACKKDTGNANKQNNANSILVGKWVYMKDTLKQYKNAVIISQSNTGGINLGTDYTLFNADGTGTESFNNNLSAFTYTNTETKLNFSFPSTGQSVATIKKVTATELVLFFDDTSTDSKGNIIRVTESAYLTKQ